MMLGFHVFRNTLIAMLETHIDPRCFSPYNPHFHPLKGTAAMPVYAALLPPLSYLVALALLPPFEHASKGIRALCALFKFAFAIVSIASFAVLPSWYHVPGSAILTYQLGLIGCFGACRGFDIFFLSHPRVPRRLAAIDLAHKEASGRLYPNGTLNEEWPVKPHPQGLRSRLWWALDLMISSEQ